MSGMVFWTSCPPGDARGKDRPPQPDPRKWAARITFSWDGLAQTSLLRYTGSSPKTIIYAGRQGRIAILEIIRLHFCWQAHCLCLKILE